MRLYSELAPHVILLRVRVHARAQGRSGAPSSGVPPLWQVGVGVLGARVCAPVPQDPPGAFG